MAGNNSKIIIIALAVLVIGGLFAAYSFYDDGSTEYDSYENISSASLESSEFISHRSPSHNIAVNESNREELNDISVIIEWGRLIDDRVSPNGSNNESPSLSIGYRTVKDGKPGSWVEDGSFNHESYSYDRLESMAEVNSDTKGYEYYGQLASYRQLMDYVEGNSGLETQGHWFVLETRIEDDNEAIEDEVQQTAFRVE